MKLSRGEPQRWVLDGIDKRSVRYAKELAIRFDCHITDIVEIALEWVYDNPEYLADLERPVAEESNV